MGCGDAFHPYDALTNEWWWEKTLKTAPEFHQLNNKRNSSVGKPIFYFSLPINSSHISDNDWETGIAIS